MNRLTAKLDVPYCININSVECGWHLDCNDCKYFDEIIKKLYHYEDLEEQGRLIEQKYGHWLSVDFNKVMCSECNQIYNIMNNDVETFEYCPKCGVKMEKVENER